MNKDLLCHASLLQRGTELTDAVHVRRVTKTFMLRARIVQVVVLVFTIKSLSDLITTFPSLVPAYRDKEAWQMGFIL